MAFLPVNASALDAGWRLAFFGLGTGMFQSPNNSAIMGASPRPYLGVASGILGTARNTGMAVGIASAGLILYTLTPPAIIAGEYLTGAEALSFMGGLKYAYLFGALLTLLAAIFSALQTKMESGPPGEKTHR